MRDLAERFATPLYVMSEDQLRRNARRLAGEFSSRWPGEFLLLPSIKANPGLALRRILTEEGDRLRRLRLRGARSGPSDRHPTRADLAERPDQGGGAARARDPRSGSGSRSTAPPSSTAPAGSRPQASACRAIGPASLSSRPARIRRASEMSTAGVSVREAIQRYKAGIPTEDILALPTEDALDPPSTSPGSTSTSAATPPSPRVWSAAVASLCRTARRAARRAGTAGRRASSTSAVAIRRRAIPFGRLASPARADAPEHAPAVDLYAETLCEPLAGGLGRSTSTPASVRLEVEPGRGLYADVGIHLATVRQRQATDTCRCRARPGSRRIRPMPTSRTSTSSSTAGRASPWAIAPTRAASLTADVTGRTCALDVIVAGRGSAAGRGGRRARVPRHRRLPGRRRVKLQRAPPPGHRRSSTATRGRADPPP